MVSNLSIEGFYILGRQACWSEVLKIHLGAEKKQFLKTVIKNQMTMDKGVLKNAPVDERKLFIKAAELDLAFSSTMENGTKNVDHLVKAVRRKGTAKGVIKNRPGLAFNPEIKYFLKNKELLKKALIGYLGAK